MSIKKNSRRKLLSLGVICYLVIVAETMSKLHPSPPPSSPLRGQTIPSGSKDRPGEEDYVVLDADLGCWGREFQDPGFAECGEGGWGHTSS